MVVIAAHPPILPRLGRKLVGIEVVLSTSVQGSGGKVWVTAMGGHCVVLLWTRDSGG